MVEYLAKYGPLALDNGYELVAIRPGSKRPLGDDWQVKTIGRAEIKRLAAYGCGIKTRLTPSVDIDVRDSDLVEHMKQFTFDLCGVTLERVGLPPKVLLPYRTDEPFPKVNSKTYIDADGNRNKVEVLGDGQQFVAFAIHPDTKKPYRWDERRGPHDTPRDSLPEITREQALEIAAEFNRQAVERGWTLARGDIDAKRDRAGGAGKIDTDDVFATDVAKTDISNDELTNLLMKVPGNDIYQTWLEIGMALWHQFDGDEEGLILWHQWSADAHNYDSDALDEKWPTFEIEGKGRAPTTARLIVKLAKAEERRLATEQLQQSLSDISLADTLDKLTEVCDVIKTIMFAPAQREQIIGAVKKRMKLLGIDAPTLATVRSMVRYQSKEVTVAPPWMKPFCYVSDEDRFYSTRSRSLLTKTAFDNTYGRYMLTKEERLEGKSFPEHQASNVALNRVQVPVVIARRYLPGEEVFTNLGGMPCVNTYTDVSVPDVPEKLSAPEREAIQRIEDHLTNLYDDQRDRKLLLSWFAHIVQTNGRSNWAPMLQGVEGDGKSFWFELMSIVLGMENVTMILGSQLEEKYTSWAEGSLLVVVNEVRLAGQNRYDVINRVKSYITDARAPIRRMNVDTYTVPNRTNYLLLSNFRDALPAGENDNRYFPMFSRFQLAEQRAEFIKANPGYYDKLYGALQHGGAIRKWLMDYELHADFDPDHRAPVSSSRREMVALDRDHDDDAFDDVLADNAPACNAVLMDTAIMAERIVAHGGTAPYGKGLNRLMSHKGFTNLGRWKIDGVNRRFWSRTPRLFMTDGAVDPLKIRAYLVDEEDPL